MLNEIWKTVLDNIAIQPTNIKLFLENFNNRFNTNKG